MDLTQARLVGLVAIGGALGSVARYGISGALSRGAFPWGTFAVNFSGTFLVGLLFFYLIGSGPLSAETSVFLFTGFFGGFTTLSTFGLQTVTLFRSGQTWLALVNAFLNGGVCVVGGFLGAALGVLLATGALTG